MKFVCDRCKTRYSIGDERVRGKILKVRCKNCANVITVREGMTTADEPPARERRNRPTTAAPATMVPGSGGALASAFAAQMSTAAPPVLQEEWYVSIDGEQHGPYTLAEAQRWVGQKPASAELYCWSEGFDDWLPVDKVSQFRNLRSARTVAPASLPAPPGPSKPSAPESESEPKPLFASTMAALESGTLIGQGLGLHLVPRPGKSADAVKANGTGAAAVPTVAPVTPRSAARPTQLGVKSPKESGAPDGNGAGNGAGDSDQLTGDELDFGEVSRVVKLADLAKAATAQSRKTARAPAIASRATGAQASLDPAIPPGIAGAVPALVPSTDDAAPVENLVAAPVVAQAHRRGLIMLIGAAAMMLMGVALAVIVIVNNSGDDDSVGGLGRTKTIDTSRPEEVVRAYMVPSDPVASSKTPRTTTQRITAPRTPTGSVSIDGTPTGGTKITSDEIQEMASKNASGTQRCYMRAQRGAQGIAIADLRRLTVTISVAKSGVVDDVQLSEHGSDSLGTCLIGMIKRWKFRESPGGLYRIVLAFAN